MTYFCDGGVEIPSSVNKKGKHRVDKVENIYSRFYPPRKN
jgi:hypothetical protein